MPFQDLREFITRLEAEGEIQRIDEEVDWNLEMGAMVRRAAEEGLPAPFFQRITGYPKGYRVLGGSVASFRRLAVAMDMAADSHPRELVAEYLHRRQRPIKPVLVKDGPCKENIHIGDEVDLLEFPVPLVHDGDGGRYIGTWHLSVSKDVGSDWVNWGTYRHMVHDEKTLGILLANPTRHLWTMYTQGYGTQNRPMEVAIAIGSEPVSTLCAAIPLPRGISEVDIAGGIRCEPVPLIECETVGLTVPATSEIVIEGEIVPGESREEGPFGEFTGYVGGERGPRPIIRVKAITHRNSPILVMSNPGIPLTDTHVVMSIAKAAEIGEALKAQGLPIGDVAVFPESSGLLTVVAVKTLYRGLAKDVAQAIWGIPLGHTQVYVIIVEDDVDPFNMGQVLHALVTKCHPAKGIVTLKKEAVLSFLPWLSNSEKKSGLGGKVYFDCTWPQDWDPMDIPRKSSFTSIYPQDIQGKALAKWRKYGY
ncbi:UbiD family decarboxylase [Chloroflexota bacterium]